MSRLFTSGGQNTGASASASVVPIDIQGWFSLELTGLILQSKGLSRVFSSSVSSVQSLSHVQLFAIPWTAACQASLSLPTAGAYSNSCPSSWWCHPIISSSVIPFSCLQSFPASGSYPMSQLFTSGGQSIGVSVSTSVLPMNTQDWLDLLAVQGTLKSLLQHQWSKPSILRCSALFIVQFSQPYMTTEKTLVLLPFLL